MVSLNMLGVPRELDFRFEGGREVTGAQDYPEVGGTGG